mmetsp:Transcript_66175/g.190950  ORF Transcript_66175/g.190950 Transcript_66175/m.190950 type:complete len:456 (-) Transcript_66175:151-1518(-)|eukprot:CAMPEP_0176052748 /NCGR_PEP_ID=MMETSP0120_2-20121206/26229_1 /TAXON_ID=160619 /ORGANISM="Kryptoperidinium foliaceum, Strain CCMP 1326" /LENGTH=455 /DNA_ID=CAMNT_0017386191 /DNA_START=45 /DNA_END=1412 /DNA_ORIENTATION=-
MVAAEGATAHDAGALPVLEAALQAWAELDPSGFSVAQENIDNRLHAIFPRVPGADRSARHAELLVDLFSPACGNDGLSVFQKMSRPRGGEVHFLRFWRAFGEVARILGNLEGCSREGPTTVDIGEALVDELELLRDSILRLPCFDESPVDGEEARCPTPSSNAEEDSDASSSASTAVPERTPEQPVTGFSDLLSAVRGAAEMSCAPEFWNSVEAALLASSKKPPTYTLDDLAVLLLRWLHEAVAWERTMVAETSSMSQRRSQLRAPALWRRASARALMKPKKEEVRMPVFLHIYDVSHEDQIHKLNKVLAHKRSPLKFGGVFHAGIEVNGLEWSFGMSLHETVPGISCSLPKKHSQHRYRQTIQLRDTRCTAEEVAELISQLIEDYPGDDYDLLRRNCCHFAQDFAKRLGSGPMPGWVQRLAKVGAMVDGAMQLVANRKLINIEEMQEAQAVQVA